jgi:hypothetical protein
MTLIIFRITFFALFFLLVTPLLFAQTVKKQGFAIQLGVFKAPDPSRYSNLTDLGDVFTVVLPTKLTRIQLGNFENRKKADSVLQIVKQRNYTTAFIIPTQYEVAIPAPPLQQNTSIKADTTKKKGQRIDRPKSITRPSFSVQLGVYDTKTGMSEIKNLEKLEQRTFEVEKDTFTKVMSGVFVSKDSAEAYLSKVKSMGYDDAFLVENDLQEALLTAPSSPMDSQMGTMTAQTFRPVRNLETASFYKRMEGTMNSVFPIIVHAYFSSASITGFYDDPRTKSRKKFVYYGYRSGSNSLPETQFSTESGLMIKASASPKEEQMKISFTVKDMDTNANLTFSLKEVYPLGSVQFDIVSIYKKKSQQKGNEELGADLYLEYPVMVKTSMKNIETKINNVAMQLAGTSEAEAMSVRIDGQLRQGLDSILKYLPQYRWLSKTYETKIMENSKNLLSFRMSSEQIIIEPQSKIVHKSFNLTNGKELLLHEVLNAGYEKPIFNILRDKIGKQFAKIYPPINEVNASAEEMMKNYYFTSQGIIFFRDYKKNQKLAEPIEITIPYSEIKLLVSKNGFLSGFIK